MVGFTYSKYIQVAENISIPANAEGCNCKGNCTNPKECACARLNGSDFPYVHHDGGRLIEAKDVVFECGPTCGCGPGCINRISQRGLKYQLEVFRTPKKGWAVRSRDFIPSGAPVCEYIGVVRRTDELDNVADNDYIFEIDCLHTMKGIGGRERRLGDASLPIDDQLQKIDEETLETVPEFCIDAGSVGNVARFINHSCEPNLFVQCVLSSHHDVRLARVVLFAAENIAPFQELTYDYGYALDSVVGPDGKIKEQLCHCGTTDCRKRLY
ncbi:Histone-lysine N-methyltransferase, H3 lysine-9 specific suvh4 [Sarracenia purpurea var. burkii]